MPICRARAALAGGRCPRPGGARARLLRDRVPGALAELRRMVADESPRVRLHVVRAASFFPELAAVEVALAATKLEVDYYLDYVIAKRCAQLARKGARVSAKALHAPGDPASVRYLLRTLGPPTSEEMPRTGRRLRKSPRPQRHLRRGPRRGTRHARPARAAPNLSRSPRHARLACRATCAALGAAAHAVIRRAAATSRRVAQARLTDKTARSLVCPRRGRTRRRHARSRVERRGGLAALVSEPHRRAALDSAAPLRASAYERVMPLLAKPLNEFEDRNTSSQRHSATRIRVAVAARRNPSPCCRAQEMIARGHQVQTAAQGIRSLPA